MLRDDMNIPPPRLRWGRPALWAFFAAMGPGILMMLADTDAGSIVTAAQSGAQWGYTMILSQLILIPMVYLVQEITVRLGLATGRAMAN